MDDTSHYAKCLTLTQKYKKTHMKRFVLTPLCLLMNFYAHVMTFGVKYSGDSWQLARFQQMEAAQESGETLTSVSNGNGFSIFLLILCIITIIMGKYMQVKWLKWVSGISGFLSLVMITYTNHHAAVLQAERTGAEYHISNMAYGMSVLSVLISIMTIILALFSESHYLKCFIALLISIIMGVVINCYHLAFGIVLLIIWLTAVPEFKMMNWIKKQPGYPHFNERFDEQNAHPEYEAIHQLDGVSTAVMTELEIPETTSSENSENH